MSQDKMIAKIKKLVSLHRPEMALTELTKLIGLYPESAELWLLKGEILFDLANLDEAKLAAEKSMEIDTEIASTFVLLGNIALQSGDNKLAKNYYYQGLEIDPNELACYANLSSVYLIDGKYDKVVFYAEKGLGIDPGDEYCLRSLSWAYYNKGEKGKASKLIEENIKHNPDNYIALKLKGDFLLLGEKYVKAKEHFASILELYPESSEARVGYKEALAGSNSFSRWVDSNNGEKVIIGILRAIFMSAILIRLIFGLPYRFLWVYLLIFSLAFCIPACAKGVGVLIAYAKNRLIRSEYSLLELILAISQPVFLLIQMLAIVGCGLVLASEESFPRVLYLTAIYLCLLQVVIATIVTNVREFSVRGVSVFCICLILAILSCVVSTNWWVPFVGSLLLTGGYFLFQMRRFLGTGLAKQLWNDK